MLNSCFLTSVELGEIYRFFAGPIRKHGPNVVGHMLGSPGQACINNRHFGNSSNPGHETPFGGDKQSHSETNVARFLIVFVCSSAMFRCEFWVQVAGHLGCNLVF